MRRKQSPNLHDGLLMHRDSALTSTLNGAFGFGCAGFTTRCSPTTLKRNEPTSSETTLSSGRVICILLGFRIAAIRDERVVSRPCRLPVTSRAFISRALRGTASYAQPFPTIADFHRSYVSRISSFERHTWDRVSSPPSITSRSSHPSWCDHSSQTAWRDLPQICLWRRQPSPRGAGGPTQSGR